MDPVDGPVAAFAVALRKLREDAGGPSYRVMAARVPCSAATLAQAAAGAKLPTLPVTLAYVDACGGDRELWRGRWEQTLAASRHPAATGGEAAQAPYRGLARFEAADQAFFFGRTKLTEHLAVVVEVHRFVLVVGPSGCGKSSVLRAGLAPRLQGRRVRVLTPGAHPHLEGVQAGEVVVVDQFEEVFTLCEDTAERRSFIDALVALGRDGSGTRMVLAVRADFLDRCAQHGELAEAVRDSTVLVGAMTAAELREAVTKPAAAVGLIVQRELTARIIEEVSGQPGGLPLMSHALLETWRRHTGKALTTAAYEAAGGIDGAVAHTAEQVYAELTPAQQERLRHLLLRMLTPGEAGNQDTRRPVAHAELLTGEGADSGPDLLERLAAARLITLNDDTAELAHEALLTAWPRLRSWVEEDRERLRVHRRLTEAASSWQEHARDTGGLYRGLRLATAREHLAEQIEALTPEEQAFLEASTAAHRNTRRRSRLRTAFISVVVTLALVAASLAWQQSAASSRHEREAHARRIIGSAESLRQSDPRLAMRLSLAAWHLADLPETRAALLTASRQPQQDTFTDPDTNPDSLRRLSTDGRSLISLGAARITRWDLDTHNSVSTASGPGPAARVAGVGLGGSDARWLPVLGLSSEASAVTLWDATTGRHDLTPLDTANQGVELSESGRRLISYRAAGSSYRVRVWDTAARRLILQVSVPRKAAGRSPATGLEMQALVRAGARLSVEAGSPDATISANDKTMALCVPGAPLQVWDLDRGHKLPTGWAPTLTPHDCRNQRLFLTPDGQRLLLPTDGDVRQWQLPSGKETAALPAPGVYEIGFSQDGTFMATAGATGLLMWRMSRLSDPLFRHPLGGELALDLRVDPARDQIRYIAAARILDGGSPSTIRTLRLNAVLNTGWRDETTGSATFSPDGRKLAVAYMNRVELHETTTGRLLPGPPPLTCPPDPLAGPVCALKVAFRPDGRVLAYGDSFRKPFRANLWDLDGLRLSGISPAPHPVQGLAFTGKGGTLLSSGKSVLGKDASPVSTLTMWDLRTGDVTATTPGISGNTMVVDPSERFLVTSQGHVADLSTGVPVPRRERIGVATALAFSPDGSRLAAGNGVGQTALWGENARRHLGTLTPASSAGDAVTALAFSADASTLAVGTASGTIQLWDTTTRQPTGSPITTPAGAVRALALHGDTLYVAGEHIPWQPYDLTPATAAATICRRVGQGLAPDAWTDYFPGYRYQPTCDPARDRPTA
ncbi:AAA family ATPase [Nonomuraea typhae]|uniref:AAA family ATPase n=1 Tax=Nonomuraea typhae TaxID=2603600 RepID=UPI0012F92C2E|nr:AAA family ATPase [Nonomuraea typhae]